MTYANQEWFDRPESLLAAGGADLNNNPAGSRSEIVAPDGKTVIARIRNGGIITPQRVILPPLTTLVRFGAGGLPQNVAAGPWWLEWNQYKIVERFADSRGFSVQVAMRLLCAVPPEWSDMTMILQAKTKVPLLAFQGIGAPVITRNARLGVLEHLDPNEFSGIQVRQLFIPGLQSPDLRKAALMIDGYGYLPTEQSKLGYFIRHAG